MLLIALMGIAIVLLASDTNLDYKHNPLSRVATMQSLVEHGTFAIDDTDFGQQTIDKSWHDGHFYSTKPFLLSIYGAAGYWLMKHGLGWSFDRRASRTIWSVTFLTAGLPYAVLLFYFIAGLPFFVKRPAAQIATFASFVFANLQIGYATTVNNHGPSATLLFIAFYYAFRIRHRLTDRPFAYVCAGLAAGLLTSVDHPSGIFFVAMIPYLWIVDREKTLKYFLIAALVPIVIQTEINYYVTGSILPMEVRRSLFLYAGSYWNAPLRNDALHEPKIVYLLQILFGHHGFLTMTPVFFLAVSEIFRNIQTRGERKAEAAFVLGPLLVWIVFYVLYTNHYGGDCVGLRWFVPVMPLMFLFAGSWLERAQDPTHWTIFILLSLVGAFNAVDALQGPWRVSRWDHMFSMFGIGGAE